MPPLSKLAARLRKALPDARLDFAEPAASGAVGFLDISYRGNVLTVTWQEKWHFGVSSPEDHGYGEKPDEVYRTVNEAATRIIDLLRSGGKTEPPVEVTLRELRAEMRVAQTRLADLLGVSQPAVSKLFDRGVGRMFVSTLRDVIRALGGNLVLEAHFPGGVVRPIVLDDASAGPEPDLAAADKSTSRASSGRRAIGDV